MRQISRLSLRDLLYILFRDKNRIIAIVLTALVAASVYLSFQDPIYVAESRLLVRIGKEKLAGVEALAKDNYNILFQERGQDIHNGLEILKDSTLAYAVLDRLRPYLEPEPPPTGWWKRSKYEFKAAVATLRRWATRPLYWFGFRTDLTPEEQMARALRGSLQVEAIEDTDIIRIAFVWTNPEFAALALNTYAEEFLNRYMRVHENIESEDFYRDQIALNRKRLAEAESALTRFRAEHDISVLPLQKEILLKEISEAEARLSDASLRYDENRALREKISTTLKTTTEWVQTPETKQKAASDLSALDKQYFELVARRAQLRGTLTDSSPELQMLARRMDQLREDKAQNLISLLSANMQSIGDEKQLLENQVSEKRSRLAALEKGTDQHEELERLRSIVEGSYLSYKKKAEELRLSTQLNTHKISGVRVISAARPPAEPSGPRKGLILGLAALIGLLLAFGYSAIAEYFNHTFRSQEDIERILGTPLLLTVPRIEAPAA